MNVLPWVFRLALALYVALVAACASPTATRVTLLPQDGGAGAVEVSSSLRSQLVNKPYQAAVVDTRGDLSTQTTSAQEVQQRYPALIARMPAAAQRFVLYFAAGAVELTPESAAQLPQLVQAAQQRPGGELIVVGHTDRVGNLQENDELSERRAAAIRELIIARGFAPQLIEAVGRGEREPLVPTADEVAEPRNRRVEVVVR
jgi:OmpA-OmpF porin, OOP family